MNKGMKGGIRIMSKSNDRGTLLLEVLLVIVILSVGLTLIIQSMVASLRAVVYSADYSMAMILAEDKMFDLLKTRSVDANFQEEGDFSKPSERFHYQIKAEPVKSVDKEATGQLNEVTLEVSWLSGGNRKSMSLVTYLSNQSKLGK